jgi:spore cortex formation protein SpoVR/YcgB (stage V sporulation)
MRDDGEEALTALKSLSANIHTLSKIAIRDLLSPTTYSLYERSLQVAYDALTSVEDALTALGMKLEYHHWRLGGALEELRPLRIHIPSVPDTNQTTV